jgi:hypothetical protein
MANNIDRIITNAYREFLLREPEEEGYNHWYKQLQSNQIKSEQEFIEIIKQAAEHVKLNGSKNNHG